MKNGQGSPNGGNGKLRFDPSGDVEVTEILPTATGLYLEEMRKACQRDPADVQDETRERFIVLFWYVIDDEPDDQYPGGSPYRHAPRGPWDPHDHWFKKPKNGKLHMVYVQTNGQKKA